MLELIVIWANNRGAIRSQYKMGRTLVCLVFFFFPSRNEEDDIRR